MVNVRSVRALRDNRNKFAENLAHEFPPQPITASDEIRVTGCCFRTYLIPVAVTHGHGVCPKAVFGSTAKNG